MQNHLKKKHTVTGDDAVYMMRAMDRQGVSYQKHGNNVLLLMTDDEYAEALEDMECEKEMADMNYQFCVLSLRTICDISDKREKILKSMNKSCYTVMEKDIDAFNEMINRDI